MKHTVAAALSSCLILSGCAVFTPPYSIKELKSGKNYVVNYDASRRGILVSVIPDGKNTVDGGKGAKIYACSEPVPDVSVTQIVSANGNVGKAGATVAQGEANFSALQQEMGGRSPAVLLGRDALYRICEFGRNVNQVDAKQMADLTRTEFLYTTLVAVAEAQAAVAKAQGQVAVAQQNGAQQDSPPPADATKGGNAGKANQNNAPDNAGKEEKSNAADQAKANLLAAQSRASQSLNNLSAQSSALTDLANQLIAQIKSAGSGKAQDQQGQTGNPPPPPQH